MRYTDLYKNGNNFVHLKFFFASLCNKIAIAFGYFYSMKVIGLTGGIGSGKSTVARVFETLGFPVFDADSEALKLYAQDETLLQDVASTFGVSVLQPNGELNRMALASIVFNDESALKKLNAMVHPRVASRFETWKKNQRTATVIREAAILFESGSAADCDAVIVVTAPEDLRVQRVIKRNGWSESEVRARMKRQWPEQHIAERADALIVNDDKQLVLPQIQKMIQEFIAV
jgi:dephospho-CoA kinase